MLSFVGTTGDRFVVERKSCAAGRLAVFASQAVRHKERRAGIARRSYEDWQVQSRAVDEFAGRGLEHEWTQAVRPNVPDLGCGLRE